MERFSPRYIVMSGVGDLTPLEEPRNWSFMPCRNKKEVRDEIIRAEGQGAETVRVFRLKEERPPL